jgi:RNA polymerase sigma factor (sigma-70 family)
VTADLITRARAGDGEAFRQLTEPHRRELLVHCYRMLGSLQDAEDALQDALLDAWRGFGGFDGRASIRTWLYRIATTRCLNALRSAGRRPAKEWDVPEVEPPEPTRLGDVVWLEPYPDARLEEAIDAPLGPEARYDRIDDHGAPPGLVSDAPVRFGSGTRSAGLGHTPRMRLTRLPAIRRTYGETYGETYGVLGFAVRRT